MSELLWCFGVYLGCVNLMAFFICGWDKRSARRKGRRISEAALFAWAAVGGAAGMLAGMLGFRHKTRHIGFVVGIPLILAIQIIAIVWFIILKF